MHEANAKRPADRRKDRRFPLLGAIDMRATGIDMDIQATLEDISGGGCRLGSRIPLQMKHPVRLSLPRPGQPELRVTGNVVRAYNATKDRMYHYGIRFRIEDDVQRGDLRRYVSLYAHVRAPAATAARNAGELVDVKLPIEVLVPETGRAFVTIVALRAGGMRIAADRVFRQEWTIKADLKLPSRDGLDTLVTVAARALPGVRESRGQYVQDWEFVDLSLRARGEIERFIHERGTNDTRRYR